MGGLFEINSPYFTKSLFFIKTSEWVNILSQPTIDAYDEIALNKYKRDNNKKFLFVKNGFGIHPMFNTVFGNNNPWGIGIENGEQLEQNFYTDLKNKIISNPNENKYNIKAPVKWLQNFEKSTELNRNIFKTFIDSYDLPNITYIVEDIKKEGGIEYKGAQSFKIAKKLSLEQESFWEQLLKNKYGESLGTQFQYENCIFDFINISTNTIFECKLGIKDWNEKQHTKYILTMDKYTIIYLIGYDCIINMKNKHIYTLDTTKYNITKKQTLFDKLIENFQIISITQLHNYI